MLFVISPFWEGRDATWFQPDGKWWYLAITGSRPSSGSRGPSKAPSGWQLRRRCVTLNKKLGISHQIKLCGFRVLLLYSPKIPANSGCCVVPFLHRISRHLTCLPRLVQDITFGPCALALSAPWFSNLASHCFAARRSNPKNRHRRHLPTTQHRCQVVISVSVRRRVRVNHATSCRKIQSRSWLKCIKRIRRKLCRSWTQCQQAFDQW